MQKRILPALFAAAFLLIIIDFGCTKIDTTTLGSDLVAVDNVNTFADTLSVTATQGLFTADSTLVVKTDNMAVGSISSDPLFGTTDAAIYAQFKPVFYPFYWGDAGDKVYASQSPDAGFDSAFICLSYKGIWGDSLSSSVIPQTFEVRQINDPAFRINTDTLRQVTYPRPVVNSTLFGSATITPQIVAQQVNIGYNPIISTVSGYTAADTLVSNQIRINLNTPAGFAWAKTFYNSMDSTTIQPNNGFYVDSIFRKNLNGFEIKVTGPGNTLYYVNLSELKSRMEFHFRKVSSTGVKSKAFEAFQFYSASSGNIAASSGTNSIIRNYTGTPLATAASASAPSDVFLQTSPGTYANIRIDSLNHYPNRIIHRAYLVVEQTPADPTTDAWFTPVPYLYMDLKDTVISSPQRYKPIYYDLNYTYPYNPDATNVLNALYHPYPVANVDVSTGGFGGTSLKRFDAFGNPFARYELNITRYVQHIVTNGLHNYDLRLFAPYSYYYPQYIGSQYVIPYYNPLAYGRVRVASGNNSNFGHRMRLVIIYSKV